MGDVKLLAMIGAFLGWKLVLLTLVMASLSGSIIGVALIASKRGNMKYALPFGTFLAIGAWCRPPGAHRSWTGTSASTNEPQAYSLLAITAMIVLVIGVIVFAGLRFLSASRRNRSHSREGGDSALMAVALQDAIQKLRAQERAMTERAEASELLNTQIVNSLSARIARCRSDRPRADPEPRWTTDARVRCDGRVAALHEVARSPLHRWQG